MKSAELKTNTELLKFRVWISFLGFITCLIIIIFLIISTDWILFHKDDQFIDVAHFYSCVWADEHQMARGQLLPLAIQRCAGHAQFLQNAQIANTYSYLVRSPIYSLLSVFSLLGLALTGKGKNHD